jgi:cell division protein FtsI (penicillin-binding protein 3)
MPRFRSSEKNDGAQTIRRIYVIAALFACCFGVLISRAVAFHLKDNGALEKVALRQYRTAVGESSRRGKILDAAGRELAIDITSESIFANPQEIENSVTASERLSQILGINRTKLLDRLSSHRKFIWVKRRTEDSEVKAVKDLNIKGVYSMRESHRSYPNGTVGATVLGAVGYDAKPLGGIELYYNDTLSAKLRPGEMKKDARGHLFLSPANDEGSADLKNIELTIDKTLQYIADNALAGGVKLAQAKRGEAVVVDVKTGAVLAMSNIPTFDPNNYEQYPLSNWRNSAVVDPHEPGSTFKVIAAATALDSGVADKDTVFDCEGGKIKIGNDVISDAHPHAKLTLADIIKVSSNIGAYKIVKEVGRKRLYESITKFGFGEKSGIDLPGETSGILAHYEDWSPVQFATIAFGQGIAATSLQLVMAFAAIANGGTLFKPYLVSRITDENGNPIFVAEPKVAAMPISKKTSEIMTSLLERVVEKGGTGILAASYEYPVAGKTGTAQKVDSHTGLYARGRFFSSFVGFAPADNPRIAVFVGIDDPRGTYYGGQVAAPIFKSIVEQSLHYLKVPATLTAQATPGGAADQFPPIKDMAELPQIISKAEGEKQVVTHEGELWRLPDFRGFTMRGVLAASGNSDIDWNFMGTGIAIRQMPAPGSLVRPGEKCMVEFAPLM